MINLIDKTKLNDFKLKVLYISYFIDRDHFKENWKCSKDLLIYEDRDTQVFKLVGEVTNEEHLDYLFKADKTIWCSSPSYHALKLRCSYENRNPRFYRWDTTTRTYAIIDSLPN